MDDFELNYFVPNIGGAFMNTTQGFIPGIFRHFQLKFVRLSLSELMRGCRGGEQCYKAGY